MSPLRQALAGFGSLARVALDPRKCTAEGPGLREAVLGQEAHFVIIARDAADHRRLTGGDRFVVITATPTAITSAFRVVDRRVPRVVCCIVIANALA
jgi:hypothetical protein